MLNKEISCLLLSHTKTQSILLAKSVVFGRCERRLDEFTFEMFKELVDMEEVTKIEMRFYAPEVLPE